MLQLFKEITTTIKLLITLAGLVSQSLISGSKDFTTRANQLIKLSIASMLP